MIRRPPRSTPLYSSAASDVYKRQPPEDTVPQGRHFRATIAKTTVQWGLKCTKSRAVAVKGFATRQAILSPNARSYSPVVDRVPGTPPEGQIRAFFNRRTRFELQGPFECILSHTVRGLCQTRTSEGRRFNKMLTERMFSFKPHCTRHMNSGFRAAPGLTWTPRRGMFAQ